MKKDAVLLLVIVIIAISGFLVALVYYKYKDQKIKILYFTNEKCIVNYLTDKLMEDAKKDFGDRIDNKTVVVSLYLNDPPDSQEVKEMREKYNVYGAPVIIINEKEFKKEYKYEIFRGEICRNFVVKPAVCL